uniref:Uncharacterized protein n=1 Tax=Arundo donax TaxID=35708 RepID=A0A0A8ZCM0_ARUDO
MGGVAPDASIG